MKVSIVAGTRPEVVKLAPVRNAFLNFDHIHPEWLATGQHGALAEQAQHVFGISPDKRLQLDWDGKGLSSLTSTLVTEVGDYLADSRPDFILVQGDTASAFAGAMAGFLNNIPVGHVEAGLRSGDMRHPFPEEGFRKLIAPLSDLHFAPTRMAARNLTREGISLDKIRVTGNPVIDAVKMVGSMEIEPSVLEELDPRKRLVLVTLHRRENWDAGVAGVCAAIKALRNQYKDLQFVLPLHLNPRVRAPIESLLGSEPNINLIEPLSYPAFIALLKRAHLVLSDSGGVQEEAPSFGVPVLVLRDKTERGEAIRAGTAKLVGTRAERILMEARGLLDSPRAYRRMAKANNPFGDGRASLRIAHAVQLFLGDTPKPEAQPVSDGLRSLRRAAAAGIADTLDSAKRAAQRA